jgi:hypothetical protein
MERDTQKLLELSHKANISAKIMKAIGYAGFLTWLTIWGLPWIAELLRIVVNRAA